MTLALLITLIAVTGLSCGSGSDEENAATSGTSGDEAISSSTLSSSATETAEAALAQTPPAETPTSPVMPNIDPADAVAVTEAAQRSFNDQQGDGSGVNVVWGPNIVDGWAIMGIENESGLSPVEALLHKENGVWVVKEMGSNLASRWRAETPAGLWP